MRFSTASNGTMDMDAISPKQLVEGRSELAVVVARAAPDRHFRRDLRADLHRAVRESLGGELPTGLRLKFIEEDVDVDLLVVLRDLVEGGEQLDPDQLDVVLGRAAETSGPATARATQ